MKKVSIIIPALNEEMHLPACLNSIASLDYPRDMIEAIVVDNGSTDRTREIAAAHGAKIVRDDASNVAGLRNLGVHHAQGEILAFVDADCIVSKQWMSEAARYFSDPEVIAWGAPPQVPENGTWVQKAWYFVRKKEKPVQPVIWLESMNLFVRKSQFNTVGGFNAALVTCEDVDFCHRIGRHGRIMADEKLVVIHLGEAHDLKAFIRKELWRGGSNWKGLKSHNLTIKELPSLAVPLYFGFLVPGMAVVAWLLNSLMLAAATVLIYLIPVTAVVRKAHAKGARLKTLAGLLILVQTYFWTRSIAIFKPRPAGRGRATSAPGPGPTFPA